MSMDWFQKSMDTLSLNGKGERTQQAYTRALRMLVEFYAKDPAEISEAELEAYFLRRKNLDRWSANTLRICYCGIRFYFVQVLARNWTLFNILRAKNESRLPTVLSREEVRRLLGCVHTAHNRAFLATVYACGLRLQEALYLEVCDIDSDRMMIHVHRGKGAKDRLVPLPQRTLETLRNHWKTHRNPRLIFPAQGRDGRAGPGASTPMAITSVQGALAWRQGAPGHHQGWGVDPYPSSRLRHALARSGRQPTGDSAPHGTFEPGDHHGLPASDAYRAGAGLRADRRPDGGSVRWARSSSCFASTARTISSASPTSPPITRR
jgi:integrase/recombinase XerD